MNFDSGIASLTALLTLAFCEISCYMREKGIAVTRSYRHGGEWKFNLKWQVVADHDLDPEEVKIAKCSSLQNQIDPWPWSATVQAVEIIDVNRKVPQLDARCLKLEAWRAWSSDSESNFKLNVAVTVTLPSRSRKGVRIQVIIRLETLQLKRSTRRRMLDRWYEDTWHHVEVRIWVFGLLILTWG